jgi:glycine/D-amino acid oxidase-like deaminating enzyme
VGSNPDVAIIGGGIVGCALAAFLAEEGAAVRLYEREHIAAGASGRNSGIVQHPLDPDLVGLYEASLDFYRDLGHGFELPAAPEGVLVVGEDAEALERMREGVALAFPELGATALEPAQLREEEPALAEDIAAYRLDTGRSTHPGTATQAFAQRARAAGAEIHEGVAAAPAIDAGRASGVVAGGRESAAGAVVVAAGPWTAALVDPTGAWRPIVAVWGVNVEVRLSHPPRHALEQAGVERLTSADGARASLFSLVTYEGTSALGSTFDPEEPDATEVGPTLVKRGARFVPALAGAHVVSVRACARPASSDGRPLLGPLPEVDRLFVAAGHGPWGVSLGPGSGRLVADAVLERTVVIPSAVAAARLAAPRA